MNGRTQRMIRYLVPVLLGLALLFSGCSRYIIYLDRPDYHYKNGFQFLSDGNLEGAQVEFEYAVFLDDEYAPAYVGLALVHGTLGEMDKALEYMARAQKIYRPEKNNP